jgi:Zn-dependent peptidase ImmA (M78 family)
MFLRFFFSRMSLQKQARYLKKKGIMLGTRIKEGRKVYIYMLSDLFAEVIFLNDNIDDEAEQLNILHGLDNLNDYLEKEFKATF